MVSKDTIPGPHDMVFWTTSIAGLQGTNGSALSSIMINNTSTLVSVLYPSLWGRVGVLGNVVAGMFKTRGLLKLWFLGDRDQDEINEKCLW